MAAPYGAEERDFLMPPFLPSPWIILGVFLALLGSFTAGELDGRSRANDKWKVTISAQKQEASNLLNDAYTLKAKQEQADADKARDIDEKHAAELAVANAGRDDFALRLRNARRGQSCGGSGGREADDPGKREGVAGGGGVGLGQTPAVDPIVQARGGVKELVAYANACYLWSMSVGR